MWNTTETITYELPDWMRQARRGVDWGVLFVIVLSLLAAWPFILYPDLPHTNASENYVYRTADYAAAFQEGQFYPRWSPDALGGYGAPIPHYYPPGATYFAAVLQVLLTNDAVMAVRLVYILSLCIAGSSVYVLVTRRTGAAAGVLAALLYVYSPYMGLVAPQLLGDLPGVVALALIPSLLWAVDRLLTANRPLDMLLIASLTAMLCLTSIHFVLVALVLVGVLAIWHGWVYGYGVSLFLILLSCILGLGLSSFYWFPALLEQDAVHWQSAVISAEPLRLALADLFTPLRSLDPDEMVATPQFTIGLIALIFSLIGGLAIFRFGRKVAFQGLFLIMGIVILVFAMLIFPTKTWLLGPISLCLSIGGSAVLSFRNYLPRSRRRLVLPALVILVWIGSTGVWFAPQRSAAFGDTSPAAQVRYEQQGYGIAVLPPGDAIPSTISDTLSYNRSLLDSYQTDTVNKIAPGQISADFQASPLNHLTYSDHFQLRQVTADTPLKILTAYFPGWYATLADRALPLTRSDDGLIETDIPVLPAANNELVLTLGTTDVRTDGWLLAVAFLIFIIVLTFRRSRHQKTGFEEMELLSRSETRLMAVPLACFVIITLAFSYVNLPISLLAPAEYKLSNSTIINTRTDAGLSLLGFRVDTNQHYAGEPFDLTLYWQTQRILSENYKVKLYLVNNRDESHWDEADFRHPGYYPTRRWNARQYVTDRYELLLPSDMTAGNYQIVLEVSACDPDCSLSNHLTFFDATGQNEGMTLTLPTLIAVSR